MAALLLSPPVHVDLRAILSESKRIISAHFGHFLALSVLFLLPISFASSAYPAIYQLFCQSSAPTIEDRLRFLINPFNQQQQPPLFPIQSLIFTLVYSLFIIIFSFLATGSITYSVFHGFYGRPVKLQASIKSAFTSFFRLMSTGITSVFIVYGILLILFLVLYSLVIAIQLLGFQVKFSSPYFTSLSLVFLIVFVSIMVYLQVNWSFSDVIVVVESSWGLEPLNRSPKLVKGLKGVAFSILLFFGFFNGILSWGSAAGWGASVAEKWKNWAFVLYIVVISILIMLLMLYNLAASTVFYIYSKDIHGEPAGEFLEKFAGEYVSLSSDDAKVLQVVCAV